MARKILRPTVLRHIAADARDGVLVTTDLLLVDYPHPLGPVVYETRISGGGAEYVKHNQTHDAALAAQAKAIEYVERGVVGTGTAGARAFSEMPEQLAPRRPWPIALMWIAYAVAGAFALTELGYWALRIVQVLQWTGGE